MCSCTSARTTCYAAGCSLAFHTYVMLRCWMCSCTSARTSCFAAGCALALPHIRHATLLYVLLCFHTYVICVNLLYFQLCAWNQHRNFSAKPSGKLRACKTRGFFTFEVRNLFPKKTMCKVLQFRTFPSSSWGCVISSPTRLLTDLVTVFILLFQKSNASHWKHILK